MQHERAFFSLSSALLSLTSDETVIFCLLINYIDGSSLCKKREKKHRKESLSRSAGSVKLEKKEVKNYLFRSES